MDAAGRVTLCAVCGVEGERFIYDEWLCERHFKETVSAVENAVRG